MTDYAKRITKRQVAAKVRRAHVDGDGRRTRRTLNVELSNLSVPLRVAAQAQVSFADGGRIVFEHDDGVRAVLCHAEGKRLYLVHQRYAEGGQRIGEEVEARLRQAYRAAYHHWRAGAGGSHSIRRKRPVHDC
jgi:hypothetical protein